MTHSVRVLIFDDQQAQLELVRYNFGLQWRKFALPGGEALPPLVFTEYTDQAELRKIISHPRLNESFDFFLCDVLIGAPNSEGTSHSEAAGFSLMSGAKSHGMPLCFAVSSGTTSTDIFDRAHETYKKDIDDIFWKSSLQGLISLEDQRKIIEKVVKGLARKGILSTVRVELDSKSWLQEARTLAVQREVGDAALQFFANEIALPKANSVKISSLSPGLSGAKILKLVFSGPQGEFASRPVLLKVSKDRQALQKEQEKYEYEVSARELRLIGKIARPIGGVGRLLEYEEWHAIAFHCASPAVSFNDWLKGPDATHDKINSFLESLFFEDGLQDAYEATSQEGEKVLANVTGSLFSEYRRMAIVEAIQQFTPLLKKYVGQEMPELSDLQNFVIDSQLNGLDASTLGRKPVKTCLVHGDFHGRNVLVTKKGERFEPIIIDVASMRRAIWCTDLVRLICDVYLTGWDAGVSAYEWSQLPVWLKTVGVVVRTIPLPDGTEIDTSNSPIRTALDWLFDRRFSAADLKGDSHESGEFSLSLAAEFARASYRDRDMTAPKRAFALVVSALLLQEAREYFLTKQ